MKKNYINNTEMLYEVIISGGKGTPSEKLKNMLWVLTCNIFNKIYSITPSLIKDDLKQSAYLTVLTMWKRFDTKKYDDCFSYYTEIIKRGFAAEFNNQNSIVSKNYKNEKIKYVRMNNYYYD